MTESELRNEMPENVSNAVKMVACENLWSCDRGYDGNSFANLFDFYMELVDDANEIEEALDEIRYGLFEVLVQEQIEIFSKFSHSMEI